MAEQAQRCLTSVIVWELLFPSGQNRYLETVACMCQSYSFCEKKKLQTSFCFFYVSLPLTFSWKGWPGRLSFIPFALRMLLYIHTWDPLGGGNFTLSWFHGRMQQALDHKNSGAFNIVTDFVCDANKVPIWSFNCRVNKAGMASRFRFNPLVPSTSLLHLPAQNNY